MPLTRPQVPTGSSEARRTRGRRSAWRAHTIDAYPVAAIIRRGRTVYTYRYDSENVTRRGKLIKTIVRDEFFFFNFKYYIRSLSVRGKKKNEFADGNVIFFFYCAFFFFFLRAAYIKCVRWTRALWIHV